MKEILEYNNYDECGRLYHKVISINYRFSNKHRECDHDNIKSIAFIHTIDKYWWIYKEDSKDETMPTNYTYQRKIKIYDFTIFSYIINVRTKYKDGIAKLNGNVEVRGFMNKG